ncbi:hypothetical protein [Candidatus Raskinella chloraquaticus]|uniref:Uncharacterized protein n=1 Tax=Candidatus Raskinella chloraquaticus TaxID=1951219 RepID=A0A1W9HYV7_9HYPH|nr:MAG: hypothetical protein A4S15_07460 [Proteobacteria bacterium SG_bin8]
MTGQDNPIDQRGRWCLAGLIMAVLAGCANLPSGGRQPVRFLSQPEGALVTTSLGPSCVTPCTLDLSRFDGFEAVFTKAGYASGKVLVASIFSPGRSDGVTIAPGIRFGLTERNSLSDPGANFRRELVPNPVQIVLEPGQ